jgi:hypothetical protein
LSTTSTSKKSKRPKPNISLEITPPRAKKQKTKPTTQPKQATPPPQQTSSPQQPKTPQTITIEFLRAQIKQIMNNHELLQNQNTLRIKTLKQHQLLQAPAAAPPPGKPAPL